MLPMRRVGTGHDVSARARVQREVDEYVIELDVAEFKSDELSIETLGPSLTVRGDQHELIGDEGKPFRVRERLEESFRLPDDADTHRISSLRKGGVLEIRAPRLTLEAHPLQIAHNEGHVLNPDAEPCREGW